MLRPIVFLREVSNLMDHMGTSAVPKRAVGLQVWAHPVTLTSGINSLFFANSPNAVSRELTNDFEVNEILIASSVPDRYSIGCLTCVDALCNIPQFADEFCRHFARLSAGRGVNDRGTVWTFAL